jgi:hypothetical protein
MQSVLAKAAPVLREVIERLERVAEDHYVVRRRRCRLDAFIRNPAPSDIPPAPGARVYSVQLGVPRCD